MLHERAALWAEHGEALSRWCASSTSNNALADFATAPDGCVLRDCLSGEGANTEISRSCGCASEPSRSSWTDGAC